MANIELRLLVRKLSPVLTNFDFENLDSDEWITTRTGIKNARFPMKKVRLIRRSRPGRPGQACLTPDKIDLIITATFTPICPCLRFMPDPAKLGIKNCAFDLKPPVADHRPCPPQPSSSKRVSINVRSSRRSHHAVHRLQRSRQLHPLRR